MRLLRVELIAVIAWASAGCDDHLVGHDLDAAAPCDREPPLTYENFGEPWLDQHCNGCHSSLLYQHQRTKAPLGVDFDTWQGVLDHAGRIDVRVSDGTMPPAAGPTEEERRLFDEWMQCEVLPIAGRNG